MIKSHPIEPEEVMAYLDGELSPERAVAAGTHLEHCGECQGLAAELRGVSQSLKTWQVEKGLASDSAIQTELEEWSAKQEEPEVASRWVSRLRILRPILSRRPALALLGLLLLVGAGVIVRFAGNNANTVFFSEVDRDALPRSAAPPTSENKFDYSQAQNQDTSAVKSIAKPKPEQQVKQFDRPEQHTESDTSAHVLYKSDSADSAAVPPLVGPMIIRTAGVNIITKDFDPARARVEEIVRQHHGYVGQLNVTGATGSGRTLQATLRIPANELDAALNEMKKLGRVEGESQNGQDVTSQYVDLQARLTNSRNTEQRLTDLLRERTGKLSDVLAVETELSRVRGEIEQMEAERKSMLNQVTFATLSATVTEDYQAQLQVVPPSTSTRLVNAAIDGYRSMVDGLLSVTLFLLSAVPSLLLWGAILFFPARFAWKKLRRSAHPI